MLNHTNHWIILSINHIYTYTGTYMYDSFRPLRQLIVIFIQYAIQATSRFLDWSSSVCSNVPFLQFHQYRIFGNTHRWGLLVKLAKFD